MGCTREYTGLTAGGTSARVARTSHRTPYEPKTRHLTERTTTKENGSYVTCFQRSCPIPHVIWP